jgi:hypothetical protein
MMEQLPMNRISPAMLSVQIEKIEVREAVAGQ